MEREIHLKKDRAQAFETVAEHYERFRPGYPTALRQRLEEQPTLCPGATLLEIGVGPGQATRLFLGRGYRVVGIEPGEQLRAVAWNTLGKPADLTLEGGTFETWEDRQCTFDLIFSGSAFHWVDPAVGFPKAARLLKPGGSLALFWNMFPDPTGPIWQELADVYQRLAPEIAEHRGKRKFAATIEERRQMIVDTGLFPDLTIHHFPWSRDCVTADYLGLLMTYSDHITLPSNQRRDLLRELGAVIDRHGGQITRPWVTVLFLARLEIG